MNEQTAQPKTLAAVFAHPDDEASVIGTLANHCDRGDNVHVIFMTRGENASSLYCSPDEIMAIRQGHAKKISDILGANYHLLDLPDSGVELTVANAKKLARVFKEIKPDIILTWGEAQQPGYGHPDHRYTSKLTIDAISYMRYKNEKDDYEPHRKSISLYTTYYPLKPSTERPFFIDVSTQLEKIMAVLDIYTEAYGNWQVKDYIKTQLNMFGRIAGVKYAEAFVKILWGTAQPYLY
ncbi:MAG: PIG-L deacetylase family protein [Asgard group archaeon]|nr:PIG-L deacetylase family protein [Asgard group archaeon]